MSSSALDRTALTADTQSVDYRSALVDRRSLVDPSRCPACGAALGGRNVCGQCRVDLSGAGGRRIWELSRAAAAALEQRVAVLDQLVAEAAAKPAPAADPAQVRPAPHPTAPSSALPSSTLPSSALPSSTAPRPTAPVGVQRVLVSTGAFLLAVAVIAFLALAWSVAGLGVRALIIAGVTAAVIGLATMLRRRLHATAEAVAALGVVLVLCDIWAARAAGLAVAEAPGAALYVTFTFVVAGAALVAGAAVTGLRAWSVGGGVLLAVGSAAAGVWLVDDVPAPEGWYVAAPAIGVAACLAALVGVGQLTGGRDELRTATLAVRVVLAGALVPVVMVAFWQLLALLGALDVVWTETPGTPLAELNNVPLAGGDGDLGVATGTALLVAALTAQWLARGRRGALRVYLGGLALSTWILVPDLPIAVSVVLFVLLAAGTAAEAVLVRIQPGVLALSRPGLVAVGVGATVSGLMLAWTTRPLSVPVTAVAALGAVAAARATRTGSASRLLLTCAGTALGLLALTVAPIWLGYPENGSIPWWALITTLAVTALTLGPLLAGRGLAGRLFAERLFAGRAVADRAVADRAVALLTVLAVHGVWILVTAEDAATGWPDTGPEGPNDALAISWWFTAVILVLVAVRGATVIAGRLGAVVAAVCAAAAPVVLAVAGYSALDLWTETSERRLTAVPAAVVLVVAIALTALVLRFGADAIGYRRRAAEGGLILVGSVTVLATAVLGAGDEAASGAGDWLWWPLLLLGAAAGAIAVGPDRQGARWLSWALLTGSWWARLQQDQPVIEVYTLLPAAALLALALFQVRGRLDAAAGASAGARALGVALLPGLSLALLPTLWASADGSPLRTVVLLVVAGLLVVVSSLVTRLFDPTSSTAAVTYVLTATGVLLALSAPAVRAVGSPGEVVEWYGPAAAAIVVLLLVDGRDIWPGLSAWLASRSGGRSAARGVEPLAVTPRAVAACLVLSASALPTLVAAARGSHTVGRAAAVEGVTVAIVLGLALALAARRVGTKPFASVARRDGAYLVAGLATVIALVSAVIGASIGARSGAGWLPGDLPLDVWTFPAGVALLLFGALALSRTPGLGSWRTTGPGLLLVLVPTLALAVGWDGTLGDALVSVSGQDGEPAGAGLREVMLVAAATSAAAVGVRARLAAPFVLGIASLVWFGLYVLGPTLVGLWNHTPPWLLLGLAGVVLLYLGATAEQRLKDVAAARAKLAAMR